MPVEEFIVSNVQWLLPTWFLRLLVRLYLRYSGGPALRGGDVVIKQIHVGCWLTEALASLPSSTPCPRQNTRRATFSLGQPRPVRRCPGWPALPGVASTQVDTVERSKEPVTVMTEEANEQHYGNDPAFFVAHLGPNLKYSACEWPSASNANGPNEPLGSGCTLAEAEAATLLIYQEKAGLSSLPKGSRVLELGCGWGSLTLANAARFPELHFTAFSNSPQQVALTLTLTLT
jgi:hypothetical protein